MNQRQNYQEFFKWLHTILQAYHDLGLLLGVVVDCGVGRVDVTSQLFVLTPHSFHGQHNLRLLPGYFTQTTYWGYNAFVYNSRELVCPQVIDVQRQALQYGLNIFVKTTIPGRFVLYNASRMAPPT